MLGTWAGLDPWVPLLSDEQARRALQVGKVVRFTSRFTPWTSNCFPQAIAARLLLGFYRIPYAVYFGVMRDPHASGMKAHAWVVGGRVYVTGGYSFERYTVVGMYVAPGSAGSAGCRSQSIGPCELTS